MKTCPKCGFTDWPYWHNRTLIPAAIYDEVCHFEDFQKMNPGMAERIRGGKASGFDEHYAYRLVTSSRQMKRSGGLVIRKPIQEYKLTGWTGPKGEKPSDYRKNPIVTIKQREDVVNEEAERISA